MWHKAKKLEGCVRNFNDPTKQLSWNSFSLLHPHPVFAQLDCLLFLRIPTRLIHLLFVFPLVRSDYLISVCFSPSRCCLLADLSTTQQVVFKNLPKKENWANHSSTCLFRYICNSNTSFLCWPFVNEWTTDNKQKSRTRLPHKRSSVQHIFNTGKATVLLPHIASISTYTTIIWTKCKIQGAFWYPLKFRGMWKSQSIGT